MIQLTAAAGKVVSRQELLDSVWPDVMVDDASLSKAVCNVRKVLQYSNADQRFIETIPKVGYRLIPEVRYPAADLCQNLQIAPVAPGIIDTRSVQKTERTLWLSDPLIRARIYLAAVSCVCILLSGYIVYQRLNPVFQFEEVVKVRHPDGSVDSLVVVSASPVVLNTSFFDLDDEAPGVDVFHDASRDSNLDID